MEIKFSPNGKLFAAGIRHGEINVYNVAKNFSLMHTMVGHTRQIWTLSFAPDSRSLISGGIDRSICLWNPTK